MRSTTRKNYEQEKWKPQGHQQEIMQEGIQAKTNIGILNAILGKADKFGTLPRPDQAFITSQMGYTGPTVFGEINLDYLKIRLD